MTAAQSERLTRACWGMATVLLAVASLALLWRPALNAELPDEAAGGLAGDSSPPFRAPTAAPAMMAERIIANNLFAATRRAPARRFAPGNEAASETDVAFDPAFGADAPALLGTVLDALGDRALILAPAVDSAARFYRVGERVGPYRVRRIDAGRVTLDGPTGRLVLHLLKPNEARP